ncbi:PIR Superfamily Protein [Plasmodium ovale curtisi]|uniref:PIR Superfamily Protein n=1 Tax=Plasmodium ovale curtisi TaxID=864141 RepID=A0A1A8VRY8_PLAOA|nr:PIR Superfamily Protein [Plasmodium ovale curtisi]
MYFFKNRRRNVRKKNYYVINFHRYLVFNNKGHANLTKVSEYNDPFLVSIASNIIENYKKSQWSIKLGTDVCTGYCEYMNKWLVYMKYLYTYGGNFACKRDLWAICMDKLWNTLEKNEGNDSWCIRNYKSYTGSLPSELISENCKSAMKANCELGKENSFVLVQSSVGSSNIALSLGYFTPLSSHIYSQIIKKRKVWKSNHAEGRNESLENYYNDIPINTRNA